MMMMMMWMIDLCKRTLIALSDLNAPYPLHLEFLFAFLGAGLDSFQETFSISTIKEFTSTGMYNFFPSCFFQFCV